MFWGLFLFYFWGVGFWWVCLLLFLFVCFFYNGNEAMNVPLYTYSISCLGKCLD